MYFVLDHVMEFEYVHVADGYCLLERLSGAPVVELHLSRLAEARLFEFLAYLPFRCPGERRADRLISEKVGGKPQMQFQNLPQIHARWDTERGEENADWADVRGI